MNKTESYIEAVTEFLAKPRKVSVGLIEDEDHFYLEGHKFLVSESEFSNVMTLTKTRRLSIRSCDFPNLGILNVMYEPDFWNRTDDSDSRIEACYKLASTFIKDMLPKVDYRFKAQVHNDGIEEILEALE